MSSKADGLIYRAQRGARVKEIRDGLGMSGPEFADAINQRGEAIGVALGFDKTKVSRLEGGVTTYLTAEEAVVIASLDPEKRGIPWLVFELPPETAVERAPTRAITYTSPGETEGRPSVAAEKPAARKPASGRREA